MQSATCVSGECSGYRSSITSRILVAGIGNIFLGDDGFGPEVVRRASDRLADSGVHLVDYGIRGMHLAYDLLDDWDALVLVDAIPTRGSPGTVHVFEADHESLRGTVALDAHSMDPAAVFASLAALGGTPPYTVVIGCESANAEEGIGLSDSVAAAVGDAVMELERVATMLKSRAEAPATVDPAGRSAATRGEGDPAGRSAATRGEGD